MTSATSNSPRHEPVMLAEALAGLNIKPGGRYIDATAGLGGHSEAILEASQPGGRLLAIDQDPTAVAMTTARLARFGDAVVVVHANFREIDRVARDQGFTEVDGILFDLGVSSMQLDTPGRGFSFMRDEPLDMRMDTTAGLTAADVVNETAEGDLADIIYQFGEEKRSRRIAHAIVERRPMRTTFELVHAIEQAVGRGRERHIHPATQTFQALRIAVNQELDFLADTLEAARGLLAGEDGRLVVIAFHSLEDRVVKQYMFKESSACLCPPRTPVCVCGHVATVRLVGRRAQKPSDSEVSRNPRARSARMRVAESILGEAA